MVVEIIHYLPSHELLGRTPDGHVVTIDPFVTGVFDAAYDNFREIGRSMVGKWYKMERYHIEADTHLPAVFKRTKRRY